MKVRAHYSLLNTIPVEKAPTLPALEPLIARWHGNRIRRIDRYIQLCIAGGLNCVGERKLAPDTGLYLASRVGAVTTSAKVMVSTGQLVEMPKPMHFVNTLGNSAGYYLTQLLGLTGNTLVLSQEHLSFEAALLHAWIDLRQGRITRALVGGFDEVPIPMEHHLERLGHPGPRRQ
jgi:3-oxoacyl-(acyl-carrier-protein) synthase